MFNIQKLGKNKELLRISLLVFSLLILIIFNSFSTAVNRNIESIFYSIKGSSTPDTNIVLIKITQNDIEKLGGWPLKRSYYALLLNKLKQFEAKKIGLEVFISSTKNSQNIYNDLIINELEKEQTVLSCYVNSILNDEGIFYADSIINPLTDLAQEYAEIGHINYLDLNDIYIPHKIVAEHDTLFSFSSLLCDGSLRQTSSNDFTKLNFYSSFNSFNSFSLIEFFDILENNSESLKSLKDKIILIGVADPSIGKSVKSHFDSDLPGIGMHAMAVDNLLNNSFLNPNYHAFSTVLFIVLILVLLLVVRKYQIYFYPILLFVFLIISYLFFHLSYIELNYTAFLLPIFLLLVMELSLSFTDKEQALAEIYNEKAILESVLISKESKLEELQSELKNSIEPPNHLLNQIKILEEQVSRYKKSQEENEKIYESKNSNQIQNFMGIIYKSSNIQKLVDLINRVAPTDATVLIMGESGSGKELVANAVYQLSTRKDKNYIAFNCAAIPDNLLESELFGHVKGAFTDANSDKIGRFEAADKGTIFLDEVGETSERFQAKLLRILQVGELQRVGSSETKIVDVRVIAATNKNLHELVQEKKFREDLYYRLNVITIEVPPLNEHPEDIPVLAEHFAKLENPELRISKAVMKNLMGNEWKGNVRELESAIKRASIFALSENRKIIKLGDLPSDLANIDKSDLEQFILESLREKEFSHSAINETAAELGNISRTVISENFRGIFFQNYVQNDFNIELAAQLIVNSGRPESLSRVKKKGETYINNIKKDLTKHNISDFEKIKQKFISKYKNLPQKYHSFLDKTIEHLLIK